MKLKFLNNLLIVLANYMNHVVQIWRFFLDFSQILAIESEKNTQNWILALSNFNISFLAYLYIPVSPRTYRL
jgi:hypothetical protein